MLRAKPAGVTSHDVVADVRRSLPRGTKVGHAGTLDPFATGLLLILLGRATRAQRFLMGLPKTYRAVARLGWTSDTGDRDGELARTGRVPERLEIPVGEQLQRPPAYSAVRVGGERAYALARRGEAVETQPRPVTVHAARLLWHEADRAAFEIECSAGTYVRTLIADLGDAYCEELERTAVGPFRLADAGLELPLAEALDFLRAAALERARGPGSEPRPARAARRRRRPRGEADGRRPAGRHRRGARGRAPARRSVRARMKVSQLAEVEPGQEPRSVAIGTFDGVHLGHREVISGADTVLTFDPHPLAVIHPEATPKLIAPFPVKRDLIAELGVDELVMIPFDRGFSEQAPEDFVNDVLIERLGARQVSVGENFRFGQGARGTADLLRSHEEFETRVVPLVEVAGETVSSSHIRGLVAAGDVKQAAVFLGKPFLFEGEVVMGDQRGRELGIPTANLVPDDAYVCPGHGVYAAWANGHATAVNVGVRPTFETGRGLLVEAHLIGFDGDLYGQQLRIAFLERMRGEKRFESVDALVEQMQRDLVQAREIADRSADLLLRFPAR